MDFNILTNRFFEFLLQIKRRSIFYLFRASINRKTWNSNKIYIDNARKQNDFKSGPVESRRNDDFSQIIFERGKELRNGVFEAFHGKFAYKKNVRILVHVPPKEFSPGGYSLFGNLIMAFDHLGVPAAPLYWNSNHQEVFDKFKPTIFLTSDNDYYLQNLNLNHLLELQSVSGLYIGLTTSAGEKSPDRLRSRLSAPIYRRVSFFYSFHSREHVASFSGYLPYHELGLSVLSVEFGANPLLYYPASPIKPDLDYVFLASSNFDKVERYWMYLRKLSSRYIGMIDGPGWKKGRAYSEASIHRFLYSRAKVGINLHIPESIEYPSELNERTYILAACGVPQLVDRAKLLPLRFSSQCMEVVDSPKEYYDAFVDLVLSTERRNKMALIALEEVYSRHTTFHRAEKFVVDILDSLSITN